MSALLKSSAAMAAATLISRVLGLVREMVYASFMGNGWVASAFILAFQIPNLFRRLLGEGALTAAFIPLFKEKEKTEGEASMWEASNAVISGLLVVSAVVVGAGMLFITALLHTVEFQESTTLMLRLLRWMLPYLLLVCFAAVCIGILNARGRFFVPALGAAMLNVVMIASVLWLAPRLGTTLPEQVYALAFGVLGAGAAQALFQMPSLVRCGWRYRWVTPWRHPVVREVIRRMIPTTIGVAAFQLNVVITQGFGFWLGDSVVASFQYAVRLMELPQGMFGVSLATFLLPALSGLIAEKKHEEFRSTLLQGLSTLAVVNLLATALLVALAQPIVRLLFQRGAFHAGATAEVAFALMFLAPGLVAFSATGILARAFYAAGDTKVPMQISVFCLALNTVFSVLFALPLREGGLALANTLTSVLNVCLLVFALKKKFSRLDFRPLFGEVRKLVAIAAGAGLATWGASWLWEVEVGGLHLGTRLGAVVVPALVGTVVYAAAVLAFRVAGAEALWTRFQQFGRGRRGARTGENPRK